MRVEGAWLTAPATRAVVTALGQVWFVGGAVRNTLLGLPVGDIDLATPLAPGEVSARAKAAGLRVVETGLAHGTVTVIAKGKGFEVTTFRRDVETDGRHARVQATEDMAEDAARRDFTMNALYAAPDGTLVDPLGVLDDVLARHLRFVGDADQRIAEDYLRILRYFRFMAHYAPDRAPDALPLAAIARHVDGLDRLSAERITAEWLKLLAAPLPLSALVAMAEVGVLARLADPVDLAAVGRLIALETGHAIAPEAVRRLAALTPDCARLRLSRAQDKAFSLLRGAMAKDDPPAVLAHLLGAVLGQSALLVRAAKRGLALPTEWQAEIARGSVARFPIKATDLPKLQGAELGKRLKHLRQLWLVSDLHADKETLLAQPFPSPQSPL